MADSYIDLANRREVYIQRFASHLRNEYLYTSLDEAYKQARLILLDAENINTLKKRDKVMESIKEAVKPITTESWVNINNELNDYAAQEAVYYAAMFGGVHAVSLSVPATDKIQEYIRKATMSLESTSGAQTGKWSQFVTTNTNSVYRQMNEQIKSGYRNEETVNQMIKRLRVISDGLLRNQAESLIRTGVSHYASQARERMMQDNRDISDRKKFSAFFDNRTTLICRHFSENIYSLDDKTAPVLPLHFGERSIYLFLVIGQDDIDGTKAAVSGRDTGAARDSYENRETRLNNKRDNPDNTKPVASKVVRKGNKDKAFKAGQISADTDMDKWMRSNPMWFIESSLGKKRAQLFVDGKVSLKGFTDAVGRPLRLDELPKG